jgi:hypothetical protein
MTFDSWSAIDSADSVIRNRKITTVVLAALHPEWTNESMAGSIETDPASDAAGRDKG